MSPTVAITNAMCKRPDQLAQRLGSQSVVRKKAPITRSQGVTGMVTVSQIPDGMGFPSSRGTGPTPVSNLLMDPCWMRLSRLYASWRFAESVPINNSFLHKTVEIRRQTIQPAAVTIIQAVEAAAQRGTVLAVRQAVQAARQAALLARHATSVFYHPTDGLDALVD
ncbi:hypothetical protein FQN60_006130 [Etheostoma spectabile]|uniref:Uncharacterized protein n=1 Tax=Etheostoma spectabile TaxID=54343 RepID=A0A5J5CNG2_9PERO|nr:hypothetical protein FQN60_006130 [Etheostoma spectabile]